MIPYWRKEVIMYFKTSVIVKWKLQRYGELIDIFEKALRKEQDALEKKLERITRNMKEEEKKEFYEFYSDDLDFELSFNMMRSYFLVLLMSFLENELKNLCWALQTARGLNVSLNDIGERGLRKPQLFLKKIAGIDFPDQAKPWQELLAYYDVRNCIVHNDGEIIETKTRDFVRKKKTLFDWDEKTSYKEVILRKKCCPDVIAKLKEFFEQLLKKIPEENR
jgi:hypothetical protein